MKDFNHIYSGKGTEIDNELKLKEQYRKAKTDNCKYHGTALSEVVPSVQIKHVLCAGSRTTSKWYAKGPGDDQECNQYPSSPDACMRHRKDITVQS